VLVPTMLGFVQVQFHAEWAAKDAVRAAGGFDVAWNVYQAYMNG